MAATFAAIEELENRVASARQDYVRRFGWSITCNTPGCYWLWQRDFAQEDAARHARWKERGPGPLGWPSEPKPYGVISAGLDLAVSMTRNELDRDDDPVCRACGCTDERACVTDGVACHWVDDDLCSACAEKEPA